MNIDTEVIKEFDSAFPGIPTKNINVFMNHISSINIDPEYWGVWLKLQKQTNNKPIINEHFEQIEIFINWYLSTKKSHEKTNNTHKHLKNIFHKKTF